MDLDAFVAVHSAEWARLDELSRRRRLSGEEVDELVALYQRAATHLSVVRTAAPDAAVAARLSSTVAWARAAIAGGSEPLWRELARYVVVSFPVAVYRIRWWAFWSFALSALVAVVAGVWAARNPDVQTAAFGSQEDIRQYVFNDFEQYYSEYANASFAARVWTNNAFIALICFLTGITGFYPANVLLQNAVNVGMAGGIMAANDRLGLFFALITPHGLLELTCVFVAAASGFKVFWAWVAPGPRPRVRALAEEGRAMLTVGLGMVFTLFCSGLVEGFVTPSQLPPWAKIAIGATVWLAFLGYWGVLGRRAAKAGETGDLDEELRGDVLPVAG